MYILQCFLDQYALAVKASDSNHPCSTTVPSRATIPGCVYTNVIHTYFTYAKNITFEEFILLVIIRIYARIILVFMLECLNTQSRLTLLESRNIIPPCYHCFLLENYIHLMQICLTHYLQEHNYHMNRVTYI